MIAFWEHFILWPYINRCFSFQKKVLIDFVKIKTSERGEERERELLDNLEE